MEERGRSMLEGERTCINERFSSEISKPCLRFQAPCESFYLKVQELTSSASVCSFGLSTRLDPPIEHPQGPIFQHFDGDSKHANHGSGHVCRAFLLFAADCCDVLGLWQPRPHYYWDAGLMVTSAFLNFRQKRGWNN